MEFPTTEVDYYAFGHGLGQPTVASEATIGRLLSQGTVPVATVARVCEAYPMIGAEAAAADGEQTAGVIDQGSIATAGIAAQVSGDVRVR